MRRTVIALAVAMLLPGTAAGGSTIGPVAGTPSSELGCPDWGMYGRTLARTFAACPGPISAATVATLVPSWFVKTPATVTASPAVVDGTVYVGDWSGTFYALDADTGAQRWAVPTTAAPGAAFGPIVSSAAVADVSDTRLVIFGAGPRVYALRASDGSVAWVRPVGDPSLDADPTQVESSPAVWEGVVYVGMDTHNQPDAQTGGVRGGLLALDAATGAVIWKFEPDDGFGCGGMWSSPVVDPSAGMAYMATANCESDEEAAWTPHVEAVTAVDLDTGEAVWSYQPHEPNRADHDFGATPSLFVDPKGRPTLGAGNKDGTYYALDPATGAHRWSTKVAEPGDARDDFSIGGFIGSSAVHEGNVYGGTALGGPPYFHALNGETGEVMWRGGSAPSYAASAAANGVVFHGALDGLFKAFDADTGAVLWSAPLAGPISSGPAVVGDAVYIGSGTSSSDACQKDAGPFTDACLFAFDEALGSTGGVHAFRLAVAPDAGAVGPILFSTQDNQLDVYDLAKSPPSWEPFIPSAAAGGKDLNAQICVLPGEEHILLGEDTDQAIGVPQGWGVFELDTRREVGKLIADYGSTVQPEQYGCAIEDVDGDLGRIFVTQVGGGGFTSSDGQLIVFFPSSPALDTVLDRTDEPVCPAGDCSELTESDSHYCVLDDDIGTAGGIEFGEDGALYVTAAAPGIPPDLPRPGRILRYAPPFPTSHEECLAVEPTVFIEDPLAATPVAIVAARDATGERTGHFYVSSVVFAPVVNEYDEDGAFVRNVLPPGFATPFGMAVGPDGTLYVADLGIDWDPTRIPSNPDRLGLDTGDAQGSVLRVRFAGGVPLPPEVLKDGLDFPDGLGLLG